MNPTWENSVHHRTGNLNMNSMSCDDEDFISEWFIGSKGIHLLHGGLPLEPSALPGGGITMVGFRLI